VNVVGPWRRGGDCLGANRESENGSENWGGGISLRINQPSTDSRFENDSVQCSARFESIKAKYVHGTSTNTLFARI